MIIKDGYGGDLKIVVFKESERTAGMWITFKKVPEKDETLSYLTIDELLDFKNMITKVLKEILIDTKEGV